MFSNYLIGEKNSVCILRVVGLQMKKGSKGIHAANFKGQPTRANFIDSIKNLIDNIQLLYLYIWTLKVI